jgi:phage-related baseplate assembly protein
VITEKINFAAFSQLLKLSNDIDFIFKGKIRPGEAPAAYRERMRGTRDQACPAGTNAMYKALTFLFGEATIGSGTDVATASVMDAFVQSVNGQLLIHVLINSDVPALKSAVITALTEAFKQEAIKPALDSVTFIEARSVPFAISASVTLQPGYGIDYKEKIEANFREAFEAQKRLGWVPAVSWIVKELHQAGVKSLILTSPTTNNPVLPERYASISSLDLSVEIPA